ncbi:MAG: alpha-2-macroglobulin family protein [Bdellovibrionales bacterium]|nr:alpha-2-macroglobulin family protein [Bdellovibrionales bacterium]
MKNAINAFRAISANIILSIVFTLSCGLSGTASGADIDPSGFSLYSGDKFYVLTDGVFSSEQNIQVRFEAGGNRNLESYGGVDVRLYRVPKPLEFLKKQKNLHRPLVKGQASGEGLSNVLSYLWDSLYKKTRLAWQRVFSSEARKTAVKEAPRLEQVPAHTYKTNFSNEPQFAAMKGFELVDSFRYPVWSAKLNEPPRDTKLDGSSSGFIQTPAGNVLLPMGKRKPGLYLIEAMIGSFRATTLAFVSDSVVVTKVSSQQAMVWTVHRKTGLSRPKSRVALTDGVGLLDQGTAGDDGVYFSRRSVSERTFALVEDQDGGVSVSENFFYDSEVYQSKVYLFTDRPLYQPGDRVSVRAFGRDLKRNGAKDIWSFLPGAQATLKVIDSTGVTLFSQKMAWNDASGGETQFRLPDSAESGGYSLRLKFEGEEYGAAFRVARFTKPHFDAQIVFDKPAYKVGEPVKGRVLLSYPSGQPVVGADIDLQLRSEQMSMFEGSYSYVGAMPVELSEKAYRSNERGEIQFSFPAATKPSRYIASARAMDAAAFRVTTKKEILIEGYLETYALSSEFNASEPGRPIQVTYVRQGAEADASQALSQWQAIRLEDRTVSSGPVSASDRGEFAMKLEKSGHYMVRVVDVNGVTRGTRSHVVLGADLKSATGQLEILADREAYSIGDKAKLLLTFPFKADDALLTVERNDVMAHGRLAAVGGWFSAKRMSDTQWQIEVPILDAHAPNVILSVAYARNGEFGFQNKGLGVKKPMIDIVFRPEKTSYSPGEKVVVNVETKLDGQPLSALVAVGVVDEMIYVLQPEIAPPISEFFHHQRRNQVRTTSSLSFYSFNPATSETVPERSTGSGTAAGRDLKVLQERARRDARDTAYWNGSLKTDANGKARFEFVMPDALTRWRITGRGIALSPGGAGAVGESKAFFFSSKPFYLKWTGPTRFRSGDKPKPAVVAFNSGGTAVAAEIVLKGSTYTFSQKITMRPGANAVVLENAPDQSQVVEAKIVVDGKVADALQTAIEFVPATWLQRQSKLIRLEKNEKLSLPTAASHVRLKVLPDSTFQFLRIADDLMEYPWGCVEQTASRLIPLSMAVRALEVASGDKAIVQSLRDRIAADRRRLIAMAGPNAEFTWWGEQTGSNLLMTAHAYHADWRASKLLGIEMPAKNWDHLLEVYAKTKESSLLGRAYTLWVLSRMGLPVQEQTKALSKEILAAPLKAFDTKASTSSSIVLDGSDFDRSFSMLIAGGVARQSGVTLDPVFQRQLDSVVASSASAPSLPPAYMAAALLYRSMAKSPGDRSVEAQKILDAIRFDTPTIDRAMALAFVEQALPQAAEIKVAARAIDLGAGWTREAQGAVATFAWNTRSSFKSTVSLPTIPGAVAEVVYDSPEELKSSLNVGLSRKLYRLTFTGTSDAEDLLTATEVKPGEPVDSRALYLDEVTVAPGAIKGRFLLLDVPLPPGGEVDGTTWGLQFDGVSPKFVEPRASSTGLGYAVPIESLGSDQKFHQLVRFSSRGQFLLPSARLFKMYRPTDRAFEGESARRAITVQ